MKENKWKDKKAVWCECGFHPHKWKGGKTISPDEINEMVAHMNKQDEEIAKLNQKIEFQAHMLSFARKATDKESLPVEAKETP